MGRKEKLLDKARNSPQRLRFDHQTGSHRIWYSSTKVRLSIQPTKNNEAKAYQVKQFLKIQEEENEFNNE